MKEKKNITSHPSFESAPKNWVRFREVGNSLSSLLPFKKSDHIKLYPELLPCVADLSTPALRVWCYIMIVATPELEEVAIDIKECCEKCGYTSVVNVYSGILELLNKQMLHRKVGTESIYFINTELFLNKAS